MKVPCALLALVLLACPAFAQKPPGGGGGQKPPGGTQPPPVPNIPPPPNPGTPPGQQQQNGPFGDQNQRSRSGVSGRIIPAPAMRTRVDLYRDMSDVRVDTTFTESDGSFKFMPNVMPSRYDVHIEVGPNAEYVETIDFTNPFPVNIMIRPAGIRRLDGGDGKPSGTTISLASLSVPNAARKEFQKARQAEKKGKQDEALKHLTKATEIYPKYAEAFNEKGAIYRRMNQRDQAEKEFQAAVLADPDWVNAYVNLGIVQVGANEPTALLATAGKITELDPDLSTGHFFYSIAQFSLGHIDEAEKSALKATRRERGRTPGVYLLLAQIYGRKGDRAGAARELREYLKASPDAPNAPQLREQLNRLEKP